ncbi:MAG: hypothetical protein GXO89_00150, partial [Chlorobi bacterium]|nr:hypothetical protein [Chlorobiota bacterium]
MNKTILSIAILFSTLLLQSQVVETTIYYSTNWKVTRNCDPAYKKVGKIDVGLQKFVEGFSIFSDDSILICKGSYDKEGKKDGRFSKYFPGGNLEYEGKYANGNRQGDWVFNYANGKQEAIVEFTGDDFTVKEFKGKNGKYLLKKGNGSFEFKLENLGIDGSIS